jgi:hypothetical protein
MCMLNPKSRANAASDLGALPGGVYLIGSIVGSSVNFTGFGLKRDKSGLSFS